MLEERIRAKVLLMVEMMGQLYETDPKEMTDLELTNVVRYNAKFLAQLIAEETALKGKGAEIQKVKTWVDKVADEIGLRMNVGKETV